MYIPQNFKETDPKKILEFIKRHAFATLITTENGVPSASHIPFLIDEAEPLRLRGHLAYANTQCGQLASNPSVMVLFQGPHCYVSPSWYQQNGVPTWNYTAVHAYGTAKLIEDEAQLKTLVNELSHENEQHFAAPWVPDYPDKMLTAIVGFEIIIDDLQAKYKLSQNKSREDQDGVIRQLQSSSSENDQQIAALMQERNKA